MKKNNRARKYLGLLILVCFAWAACWELGWIPADRLPFLTGQSSPEQPLAGEDGAARGSLQTVSIGDVLPSRLEEQSEPDLSTVEHELITAKEESENPAIETDIFTDSTATIANELKRTDDNLNVTPVAGTKPSAPRRLSQQQLKNIAQLIDEGKDRVAHKQLSAWYWNFPQDRSKFQEEIETLAKSIYLSPQPLYEEPYVIQSGDQLRKIARKHKLSWKYLARLNRVNPRKIRVGQKLKIVKGPFDAVVDLSEFEITVLCHGQYVRRYSVGIGKDGTSPLGKFTVKDKLEDPTYYGPDGVIANDAPENPLGERWIDIGDSFGIHGTIDPESIGKSESRGCIRMLNEEVEEVYDFLTIGSTVWIRR